MGLLILNKQAIDAKTEQDDAYQTSQELFLSYLTVDIKTFNGQHGTWSEIHKVSFINTWTHPMICRVSTVITFYLNLNVTLIDTLY